MRHIGIAIVMMLVTAGALADTLSPQRQQELLDLLRNDCGACHGLTMKGGLGLPLTPTALQEKDERGLVLTILDGRPGTAMPPWRRFLTDAEAQWMVQQLLHGLPTSEAHNEKQK